MIEHSTHEQVTARVEDIVREHVGSKTPLSQEADLLNDLAMDSLELVELSLKLEKTFGIKLPMAEVRRCTILADITDLVVQKTREQSLEKVENA